MQGSTVDLDCSLDWSFGLCVGSVLVLFMRHSALILGLYFLFSKDFRATSIAIVSPGAVDSFGRPGFIQKICWVIRLWMAGLSWDLSHLCVVFIALWLAAAAIVVDSLP